MNNILLAVEVASMAIAAVAGVLWLCNPDGPYEAIAFMSTLVGTTLVDLVRRHYAAQEMRKRQDEAREEILEGFEAVLNKIAAIKAEVDAHSQAKLWQQLIDELPQIVSNVITAMDNVPTLPLDSTDSRMEVTEKRIRTTLAEAYGVDPLQVQGSLPPEKVKPWRYGGLEG